MNMKKRICALILTAACAVSLYGCGKDRVQENKENTGLGQAETGADEADTDTGQENDNTDRQPSDQLDEQSDDPSDGTVELTVWGAQEDEELMQQVLDSFQNERNLRLHMRRRVNQGVKMSCLEIWSRGQMCLRLQMTS